MSSVSVEKRINTDILVIGGGLAGCFTAIKAREHGVEVTLVDKGYVGKTSGIQPFPGDLQVFDPARGHKLEEWINQIRQGGEYLNNQDWSETVLKESLDRFKDIIAWGVEFSRTDGDLATHRMGVMEHFSMVSGQFLPALRKKAQDSGVRIMDRVMACEILKQDGKAAGVIGFHTTSGDLYVIQAKAVVIATGSSSLELGTDDIGFDHGVHAFFVDFQDVVHTPEVQLDAVRAGGVAIQPAGAGCLVLDFMLVAELDDRLDFFGVPGERHRFKPG
jgi:succinate dehydrogenase/fumarate reductase flavoprotein subunit